MSGPDLLGGYGKGSETQWLTSWVAQEKRTLLQGNVGHMRVAFWNRLNKKGWWQEGLALGGWGSLWFLSKMWLGSLNGSAGRKGNTIKGEYAGMHQVHSIRRASGEDPIWWSRVRRKLGIRPFKDPLHLPLNSAQAINFSPHPTTVTSAISTWVQWCTLAHTLTHTWTVHMAEENSVLDMDGWILGREFPTSVIWVLLYLLCNTGTETKGLHLNQTSPSLPPPSRDWPVGGAWAEV